MAHIRTKNLSALRKGESFCLGKVTGFKMGSKGSQYAVYSFIVNNRIYTSSTGVEYRIQRNSHAWYIGENVFVRYALVDPAICNPLTELPPNIKLGDTVFER